MSGSYSNYQNLTPFFLFSQSGRTLPLCGTASLQRNLGEHSNVQFGYSWTHQIVSRESDVSADIPNVNRVFVTLNFTFSKPLQR